MYKRLLNTLAAAAFAACLCLTGKSNSSDLRSDAAGRRSGGFKVETTPETMAETPYFTWVHLKSRFLVFRSRWARKVTSTVRLASMLGADMLA